MNELKYPCFDGSWIAVSEINETSDFFIRIQGSKVWPSSDPSDSPFDEFKCRLCGWEFSGRVYGDFPLGAKDGEARALERMKDHVYLKHRSAPAWEVSPL